MRGSGGGWQSCEGISWGIGQWYDVCERAETRGRLGTDGTKMTSIQTLGLDGSVELLVGHLLVDLEVKLCTWLEDKGNLVVHHARWQSEDEQNGFAKVRMRFGVVSDRHGWVSHRGCCRQEKSEKE